MKKLYRKWYGKIVGLHAGYRTGYRMEELADRIKARKAAKRPPVSTTPAEGGVASDKMEVSDSPPGLDIYRYAKLPPHMRLASGTGSVRCQPISGAGPWYPISSTQSLGDQLRHAGFTDMAFLVSEPFPPGFVFEATIDGHHEEFEAITWPSGKIKEVKNRTVVRTL